MNFTINLHNQFVLKAAKIYYVSVYCHLTAKFKPC